MALEYSVYSVYVHTRSTFLFMYENIVITVVTTSTGVLGVVYRVVALRVSMYSKFHTVLGRRIRSTRTVLVCQVYAASTM